MGKYPWQGVRFRIHPLLMATIGVSIWTGYYVEMITLLVLLVVHELGHVTAAWSYGWRIVSICLFPFGGVADVDDRGYTHWQQEIVVALAGPFYHILLMAMGLGLQTIALKTGESYLISDEFLQYFTYCNIFLALFNLLPIYPLDGGRILHALLSLCMPWRQAWIWTFRLSIVSLVLFLLSIFVMPTEGIAWNLVGLVVFLSLVNWQAKQYIPYRQFRFLWHRFMHGTPDTARLMTLQPTDTATVEQVLQQLYRERRHAILVHVPTHGTLVVPEAPLLQWYFQNRQISLPLRDLILSWYAQGRSFLIDRGRKESTGKEFQ